MLFNKEKTQRIKRILKTWGPAWLVMIADVDAASVITAAESGVQYGTKLIWFLLILIIPLIIIQEVAGRVGLITNKGLGELIRENYSKRTAVLASVPMALVDIISYVVEYTGIAIGFQILGISPIISVPFTFVVHILIVYKKKYTDSEKPLIIISVFFMAAWIISAYLTARNGIKFVPFYISSSPGFIFLLAANIGAVIMPFMLFYQASATAEKGLTSKNLKLMRIETTIGAIVSEVIMAAIAIAAIGIQKDSLNFASPLTLAKGLSSVAGGYAPYIFSFGLVTASFIALIVISLGSCWGVTEALGWGRKNWFNVYIIESIPAVIVPLLSLNLINLALNLMVLQILVLVAPAIILGMLSSNKKLMGEYTLSSYNKFSYWAFLLLIFGTGLLSVVYQF
jgi:manganese transport protein